MQLQLQLYGVGQDPLSPVYAPPRQEPTSEVELALGHEIPPHLTRWHQACQTFLESPDHTIRIEAATYLPEVITERRFAGKNSNNCGKLLTLYEAVLERQPAAVQATAARWAGLLALRSFLTENSPPIGEALVGPEKLRIQDWPYRTNNERANRICELLRQHDNGTVRATAISSIDYWYSQPITRQSITSF